MTLCILRCSQVSWVDGFSLFYLLSESIAGNCQFRMSLLQLFKDHSQLIILQCHNNIIPVLYENVQKNLINVTDSVRESIHTTKALA